MRDELLFAVTGLVLLYAGVNLARYGEALAEKTNLSATWIGLFLVAAITSVPELMTGLSSILLVGEPDLAVGDALGSTVFNLGLAAVAALGLRRTLTTSADRRLYLIAGGYATVMFAFVATGILAARRSGLTMMVALATAAVAVLYFIASRHLFAVQAASAKPRTGSWDGVSRRRVVGNFAFHGALVVAAALLLPTFAERIAAERGLGLSFVGTILLAGTTSLPELVVVLSALQLRALHLALGGLLGSNLFDLVILAIDDVFYARGALLAAVSAHHLFTIATALVMTWLLLVALPRDARPRAPFLVGALGVHATFVALSAGAFARAHLAPAGGP